MEFFDVVDDKGNPTGEVVSRDRAHKEGIQHRTSHVWIVRKSTKGYDILLQKRNINKDSFPGMYDTSSAGHIKAGDEPINSAIRELEEELGIKADVSQLLYIGIFHGKYEKEFHGSLFKDNEMANVFVYQDVVDIDKLTLQSDEVEEVKWFDIEEVWDEIQHCRDRFCVPIGGLNILRSHLNSFTK